MTEVMIGMQDTELASSPTMDLPEDNGIGNSSNNTLWSYINEGSINGIPVEDSAKGLPIDNEYRLFDAFMIHRDPKVLVARIDPDNQDTLKEYRELLERAASTDIEIIEEYKQYDPEHSSFVLWVRYDVLRYVLHPRYKYLMEE